MLFLMPENALKVVSERLKIKIFPGGACPQTPLGLHMHSQKLLKNISRNTNRLLFMHSYNHTCTIIDNYLWYNRAGANTKGTHLKSPVGVHIFAKKNPPPIKILGTALHTQVAREYMAIHITVQQMKCTFYMGV